MNSMKAGFVHKKFKNRHLIWICKRNRQPSYIDDGVLKDEVIHVNTKENGAYFKDYWTQKYRLLGRWKQDYDQKLGTKILKD